MGAEFAADFFADFLSTWAPTLPNFLGADFFCAENLTKHMLFITQKIGTPKNRQRLHAKNSASGGADFVC